MIAFEIALLIFFGVILVVGMKAIANPITEAYAEKMRFKYRELGSAAELQLKEKVQVLEAEVIELKQQVRSLQESVDFAIKQGEAEAAEGSTIKTCKQQEQS